MCSDDGLVIFKNMSNSEVERKKKYLIKMFQRNGLPITAKTNLNVAVFFNVNFDLIQDVYRPYKKSNEDPLYIDWNSNHPLTVIKQITKAQSNRISDILCGSRAAAASKMERFVITVKHSMLDDAAALDPPLTKVL